jgi:hypothetical protein
MTTWFPRCDGIIVTVGRCEIHGFQGFQSTLSPLRLLRSNSENYVLYSGMNICSSTELSLTQPQDPRPIISKASKVYESISFFRKADVRTILADSQSPLDHQLGHLWSWHIYRQFSGELLFEKDDGGRRHISQLG